MPPGQPCRHPPCCRPPAMPPARDAARRGRRLPAGAAARRGRRPPGIPSARGRSPPGRAALVPTWTLERQRRYQRSRSDKGRCAARAPRCRARAPLPPRATAAPCLMYVKVHLPRPGTFWITGGRKPAEGQWGPSRLTRATRGPDALRYGGAGDGPRAVQRSRFRPAAGDWLSGRAPRSHRGGHWFDPSIAHPAQRPVPDHGPAVSDLPATVTSEPWPAWPSPLLTCGPRDQQ